MTLQESVFLVAIAIAWPNVAGRAALVVLGDGGDLPGAVAAAQHGDVIELRSNGVFPGSLSWENKYITIRAGSGFTPTIQGSINDIDGNSSTGGTLRGLTVTGGLGLSSNSTRFSTFVIEDSTFQSGSGLGGTGSFTVDLDVVRSRFLSGFSIGGTGNFKVDLTASDSQFLGGTNFSGTGDMHLKAALTRNIFDGFTSFNPTGDVVYDLDFVENEFRTRAYTSGTGNLVDVQFDFARNRFREGIDVFVDHYDKVTLNMTNNLIGGVAHQPTTNEAGILLRSYYNTIHFANINMLFKNNTVAGFNTGIEVRGFQPDVYPTQTNIKFANMLLMNDDDLLNVKSTDISYSLISDGTYAGQNSNFAGIPLLGPEGQLLAGSIGIDRGNNSVAVGPDLLGNLRIRDGNADGVSVVDVGAYEFAVPEPTSLGLIGVALFALSFNCCVGRRSQ